MAHDQADYDALVARLGPRVGARSGLSERRIFGALCVMLNGNMLCGVRAGGAMARVGKANMGAALALEGVEPAVMGGRRMAGFVEVGSGALDDDAVMDPLLDLAFGFVGSLPAK